MTQPEPNSPAQAATIEVDAPEAAQQSRYAHVERFPLRNRRFLLTLLVILMLATLWIAWPYRAAIVLAIVLGYVLRPVYLRVLKALRFKWAAAGLMLILVAAALVVPLAYMAWSLLDELVAIRESMQNDGYRWRLVVFLQGLGLPAATAQDLIARGFSAATGLLEGLLVAALTNALHLILGLVVFFILLFYVLTDGDRMVRAYHEYIPLGRHRRERLLAQTGGRVRAIMLGTFFVYALQGVVGGLGWWIFGFPQPLFWGFVMTIMAVLPFMGPQLIAIPAAIIAIAQGDTFSGVGLLIWTLVAVSLIDDIVRPYVIGRQSGVHPALILVGTLGGIQVLGLSGLILGPLILGLVEPVLRVWSRATDEPARADASSGAGSGGPPEAGAAAPRRGWRRRLPPAS